MYKGIDFESAVIAAIEEAFPNARIRGCLFHFSQVMLSIKLTQSI